MIKTLFICALIFGLSSGTLSEEAEVIAKKLKLPPAKKAIMLPATDKKTLLFDLDETLVHCNSNSFIPGDVLLNISYEGEKMEVKN